MPNRWELDVSASRGRCPLSVWWHGPLAALVGSVPSFSRRRSRRRGGGRARSTSAMTTRQLLDVADAGAAAAGDVPVRSRRAHALELHSRRDVPAQRPADQGDDRAAAEAGARAAEERPERSRLPDLHVDHPAREHPARRRGRRAAGARSGGLPLLGLRDAVGQGHVGLAGRRASRVAALQRGQRHGDRQHADLCRIEPGGSARRRRRRASACSAMLEDPGRALVTALDASQRTTGDHQRHAPNEIVTTNKLDIDPLDARRHQGVGDDAGAARSADEGCSTRTPG